MAVAEQADVVVIGGGPAGSATATHLERAGLDVVLLDKATFPRDKACAEYCSPGVVDALEKLGALDRIKWRDHRDLASMRVVARGTEIPLRFDSDRKVGNFALGIKRSILDDELLEYAAQNGVRVRQQTRVTSPIIENQRVAGVTCKTENREWSIRARFVVAADGIHSTLVRSLGLERAVRWPRRLGLVARFTGLPRPVVSGQMHIGDGVYCGLSPVTQHEVNVSLVVPMGSKPGGSPTGAYFEKSVRRLPGIAELLGDAERITSVRGIGPLGKRVRRTTGPGFLLVGDAAGFFDPLTGEGIHRALVGGELAANAIVRALERNDPRAVGYRQARSHAFRDKQRVCWIIQLLLSSPTALDYTTSRVSRRETVSGALCGILGDYAPARQALNPSFLWRLLRP